VKLFLEEFSAGDWILLWSLGMILLLADSLMIPDFIEVVNQ
jgi:hypothetical protein